jgi:hypothetical protein
MRGGIPNLPSLEVVLMLLQQAQVPGPLPALSMTKSAIQTSSPPLVERTRRDQRGDWIALLFWCACASLMATIILLDLVFGLVGR